MSAGLLDWVMVADLTDRTISTECIPSGWQRDFIGGKGLGARYLYERVPKGVDPLDPANVLLLVVGPLSGYLPGDSRFAAITKSPLTGLFLDSYAGGSWARSFRATFPTAAGIMVTGGADGSFIVDLRGESPTVTERDDLAGKPVHVVDDQFRDASVLTVGPAGEAGVTYATIAGDGGDHHAGRGGAGAVMGSKGLKAIVVPQCNELEPPSPAIGRLCDALLSAYEETPYGQSYRSSGTMETVEFADSTGLLSSFAWQKRGFSGAERLGIDAVRKSATGREDETGSIPGDYRIESNAGNTVIRGGTPISLGANLGLADFDAVATLGTICDQLGIDVISAGNVVSLAMVASERGHLERDIAFGDQSEAERLLHEISTRSTELGSILAEGVERAATDLCLDDVVPTVKAMEVPSFDPRGAPALALAYATSDRGACHRRAVPATAQVFEPSWTPTQTAEAVVAEQNRRAGLWCLIVDDLATPLLGDIGQQWSAALGIDVHRGELDRVGERTWTLTRLFNVREGIRREDDLLPDIFSESNGIDCQWFNRARQRYYELREWDRAGRPSRRLLERLDLDGFVDEETPIGGHPLHR